MRRLSTLVCQPDNNLPILLTFPRERELGGGYQPSCTIFPVGTFRLSEASFLHLPSMLLSFSNSQVLVARSAATESEGSSVSYLLL